MMPERHNKNQAALHADCTRRTQCWCGGRFDPERQVAIEAIDRHELAELRAGNERLTEDIARMKQELRDAAAYIQEQDSEADKAEADIERLRTALGRIANHDGTDASGVYDEWSEAAAFNQCRQIAAEALSQT